MRDRILKKLIYFPLAALMLSLVFACNKKEEEESDIVVTSSIVAVKNFYLQAKPSVISNLDSVFFSIDLDNGVIFNADSLPKGTDVTKLIASITFANTMTKADLIFKKDNQTDTTVNYLKNATDSIDFTHPVKLEVTAQDGVSDYTYIIKVNVHQMDPDTIVWAKMAVSQLPSRMENPVAQKTIWHDSTAYCLVEENNGSYTLSICENLNDGNWTKQQIEFGFNPSIESLTSGSDRFWILDQQGLLYSSFDMMSWTEEGLHLVSILGAFEDGVLGIKENENVFVFTQYPQPADFIEKEVPSDFPLHQYSKLETMETDWAEGQIAFLCGGITAEGDLSSSVWAFDGADWAVINNSVLPALRSPMLAHYVVYRDTPYVFLKREFDVWLLFGGMSQDESFNNKMYLSYDNGVNWSLAPEGMQLPTNFPSLAEADVIVANYPLSTDLSDAWSTESGSATRTEYFIEGTEITWNCPYLFVFGGYNESRTLSTIIWRGVLNRLTFTPLI